MNTLRYVFLRIPFTLIQIIGMTIAAVLTDSLFGHTSSDWVNSIGFSPNDVWNGQIWRVVSCNWVTMGATAFWGTIVLIALIVGYTEWILGTKRSVFTFWGGHLLAMLILAMAILLFEEPFHNLAIQTTASTRDIGASAGYFCCLGTICASMRAPWKPISILAGFAYLFLAILWTIQPAGIEATEYSSSLVHLIAFPLGIFFLSIKCKKDKKSTISPA